MGKPKACPTCNLTRWEARSVDGYVDSLRAENERLRAALREVQDLSWTDGAAAPLLVRAGDCATAALAA